MNKKKIFIAIDTNKVSKAKKIIRDTQTNKIKIGYKFGLEFMNSKNGRRFISSLRNKIIFIDLKLNDTVNTMVSAVKALKDLKINYLTVHISSGLEALKAAKKVSGKTKLIGVTILTSLDNKSLKDIGFNKDVKKIVLQQARLANKAKLDALVCSAKEVKIVNKISSDTLGEEILSKIDVSKMVNQIWNGKDIAPSKMKKEDMMDFFKKILICGISLLV